MNNSIFYNDTFKILLALKESEMAIGNEKYSLLLYKDIGDKLGFTRQTVSKYMKVLEENGYIEIINRGRTKITEEGNKIIKKIK